MDSKKWFIFLVIAAMLLVATPSFGFFSGTVTDTIGWAVSGATVTFTDESDTTRFFAVETDSNGKFTGDIRVSVREDTSVPPKPFALSQNFPNPFNPSTVIPFDLEHAGMVKLTVYSSQGQKVCSLADGYFLPGHHMVTWMGKDDRGKPVGAGVYFYTIRVGNRSDSRKMLLLDGGNVPGGIAARNVSVKFLTKDMKVHSTTWKVEIRSNEIATYSRSGLVLIDGEQCNFVVTRNPIPIGQETFYMPGEIIVTFADSLNFTRIHSFITSFDLNPINIYADSSFMVWIQVDFGRASDYISRLESDPAVVWADQRGYPFDDRDPQKEYILVYFRGTVSEMNAIALIEKIQNLTWKRNLYSLRWAVIAVPVGHEQEWIDIFSQHQEVRAAGLNCFFNAGTERM